MAGARRSDPPDRRKPAPRSLESIARIKDPAARLRACSSYLAEEPADIAALTLAAETRIALGQVAEALGTLLRAAELELDRGGTRAAAELCSRLLAIDSGHRGGRALAQRLRESPGVTPELRKLLESWRRQRVREGAPVVLASPRGRMLTETDATAETPLPAAGQETRRARSVSEVAREQGAGRQARSRRIPATLDAPTVVEELPAAKRSRALFSDGAAAPHLRTISDAVEAEIASPPAPRTRPPASVLPHEVVEKGRSRRLARNELLFHEKDAGHELYLLLKGQLELVKWERSSRRTRIAVLEAGALAGELALLGDGVHHLSAKALEPCELLQIPRAIVKTALETSPALERALRSLYRDRLQSTLTRTSPLFVGLGAAECAALLGAMKPKRLQAGQVAVREGAASTALQLILLGAVRISVEREGEPVLVGRLADCDFFGEISLLTGEPATATVEAEGFVQLLIMPRPALESALAEHEPFRRALQEEAKRRERVVRAILRGTARYDERRNAVVYLPRTK
jgi:CRP-like cAMP-binding protein